MATPQRRFDDREVPQRRHDDAIRDLGHDVLGSIAASTPSLLVAAIEASPVNITIADMTKPEMPLAYANPAFTGTTGYSVEEVIGQNCRFLQGPDTDPAAIDALRMAIAKERKVEVEFTNYRKDGTAFINALKMAPVHDQRGNLVSFVGIQNDVTEERARAKSEVARQRIEALGTMAGGVAHQLNNLLQPIVTLVSLHREDLKSTSMEADFDLVLESARQAADVVRDILSFSRTSDEIFAKMNVTDTVRQSVDFIRTMLPVGAIVELTIAPETEEMMAQIDGTQFCQALTNLMINASQATNAKGQIEVRVKPNGSDHIDISVSDDGPGIPMENRARVLEPFFTTRSGEGGTGLGLPLVYRIIKGFHGKVAINDVDASGGCSITMTLPLAK